MELLLEGKINECPSVRVRAQMNPRYSNDSGHLAADGVVPDSAGIGHSMGGHRQAAAGMAGVTAQATKSPARFSVRSQLAKKIAPIWLAGAKPPEREVPCGGP